MSAATTYRNLELVRDIKLKIIYAKVFVNKFTLPVLK